MSLIRNIVKGTNSFNTFCVQVMSNEGAEKKQDRKFVISRKEIRELYPH